MKKCIAALSILLLISCTGKNAESSRQADQDKQAPKSFSMLTIPAILVEPGARAQYLVENYWRLFDFSDTAYLEIEVTEQAFVNFAQMLRMSDLVPYNRAVAGIHSMLDKAQVNNAMYHYFTKLYKKYFYQGNSPLMNDEYYIPVLEHMLQSPLSSLSIKTTVQLELKRLMRDRSGELAEDFDYTLISGKTQRLYSIKAAFTLIFFNNPDCPACESVLNQLSASPVLSELLEQLLASELHQ